MKHYKIILSVFAVLSLIGCSKDYLDAEPTAEISSDKLAQLVKKDPKVLNSILLGVYTTMLTTGSGGTTNHDDFGQKGYDIYTDILCSDMVLGATTYGWYSALVRYQSTLDFASNPTYQPWRYYYRIILSTNQIIEALGGNNAVLTSNDAKFIMGQAKAMRGYAYFYLAQLYQKEYLPDELILPIYTDSKVPNQPKSKASEVYALIIKDLSDAVALLETFNRPAKSSVDKSVAQGLLAYAYAAQGDYTNVLAVTNSVIGSGVYPLTTANQLVGRLDSSGKLINSESGFNNVSTPSWMWGVDLTSANNLNLVSWWGQVDYFTYSYAWAGDPKLIDKDLYNNIKSTDIRKGQFTASGRPSQKFFDPARVVGGQRTVTTDYIYMRIEEVYLLNAEAKAKLGDNAGARARLRELLAIRGVDSAYLEALSGTSLQNEIYLQTRIEFWGEGKSYLAMKRNKATITRGANHLFFAGQSFPYNDERLTFKIPQIEIINNPLIK